MMAAQYEVDGGEPAGNVADAHRQLLTDNSIQFELPTASQYAPSRGLPAQSGPSGYGPPTDPSALPPGHTVPVSPSTAPPPAPAPDMPAPNSGGGVEGLVEIFLWVAAGIALAILLYWIFSYIRDRRPGGDEPRAKKGRRAGKEKDVWRPAEEPARQLLDEADVLAGEGRFDEAARLLLHRSIGEIDAHRPDLVRPALTSRDIAGHPLLPTAPGAAFARIAALVERSLFARRPLGPDDWQACRTAYREFAFAEGWRG